MTETTDSRQIRMLVQGILFNYGIDNLGLECNLSSGLLRYLQERIQGNKNKAGIRETILADMEIAARKSSIKEDILKRVKQVLGDMSGSRFEQTIDFLIRHDEMGETIEAFGEWLEGDKYKRPAKWKFLDRPALLIELWPSAFPGKQETASEIQYTRHDPKEDEKYVPPPENLKPNIRK